MKHLLLIVAIIFFFNSCSLLVKPVAGAFSEDPLEMPEKMSTEAKALVQKSFEGIDRSKLRDFHVHVVGLGKGGSGIWVTPKMQKWYKLGKYIKYHAYLSASGITDTSIADQQYVERLVDLVKGPRIYGKVHLLAFDKHYRKDGSEALEYSTFYVPNEYVFKLANQYPDIFIPTISVNPYRKDALEELEKWGKQGAKYIKWLPNAMGIDAADEDLIPFYEMVKKYDMAILTHTGLEKAVEGDGFQHLGNPARFIRPLDMGVKIIMAHIASLGECTGLNGEPGQDCFDVFWDLFNDKKYEKNLFADVSAVTLAGRLGKPIDKILEHPELHHRLVNGSDYPLPAINILYKTGKMVDMGYFSKEERKLLNEIYDFNPLLFNFVMKRTLSHPKTGQKFAPVTFEVPEALK